MTGADERKHIPLSLQIVIGIVVGVVVGPLLGARAAPLGELGKLVIQLIKAVATPLLFFAIVNAILTSPALGRGALRMFGLALVNASIALGIGLLLSNAIQPGRMLGIASLAGHAAAPAGAATTDKKVDVLKTLSGYVPSNLVQPFAENLVLSVVLLALLFGFAVRGLRRDAGGKAQVLEDAVSALLGVTEIVLGWVIRLIPIAVFGVVGKTVAEHGFAPLKGLGVYLGVGLLGLALHIGITYQLWIALATRVGLRRFWAAAKEPVIYAAGANSSLATLPLTLKALDRLGVSRSSSALGACVGTNFNNDGILLYEGMAVLFVAQAHGLDLSLGQQLLAAGACLVAAMGVAGVPEAGIISLALVLNTVGLPLEILPILLTVDWILGRGRSVANVLSDMMLSILIDRRAKKPEPEALP
jgi:DAACS family dicarboxylate/amino acid:cation (Na+ or H+) symporter